MVQIVDVAITIGVPLFFFLMGLAVKYLHDMTVVVKNMDTTLSEKMDTINTSVEGISDQMGDIKELMIRVDTRLTATDGGVNQATRETQNSERSTESKQGQSEQSQESTFNLSDTESDSYATSTKTMQLEHSDEPLQVKQIQRPRSTMVEFLSSADPNVSYHFGNPSLKNYLYISGINYFDQPIDIVVKRHKTSVIIPSTDSDLVRNWIEEAVKIIDRSNNASDERLPE